MTRRQVLQLGAGVLVLSSSKAFALPSAATKTRVAFFSDTHVAVGRNIKENEAMLAEIRALNPAFCINAGDVTDQGWAEQVELYLGLVKESGLKVHHCPGNHDVRWSPQGPLIFEESFGKPYRAFEFEGCWFILLDTTVPLSHWGNVASPQVAWLERTLKLIGPDAPIFLFGHHWLGREGVQIDNEYAIIKMLRRYNVKLIGNGHGHNDLKWDVEGRVALMNKGLYQLSYCVIDIDHLVKEVVVTRRTAEKPLHEIARIPLAKGVRPKDWYVDSRILEELPGAALMKLNAGPWLSMDDAFKAWNMPGYHDLYVRLPDSPYIGHEEIAGPTGEIKSVWSKPLPGGVMGQVVLADDSVIVSTMDGSVLRFHTYMGEKLWQKKIGGFCHSTPVVSGGKVFVGSSDGYLYALDFKTGKELWKKRLMGPVYAGPAVAKGIVFVPNHGVFYGIDAASGEVRWRTGMPKANTNFGQSVAATDGEVFIAGCWDSHLYCLDALTGEVRWRNACQERTFAFSPAIGSPVIADGHAYVVANGNGLFKFEIATGDKVFEVASPGQKFGHSGPCVVGDRVFAGCLGDGEGEVRCVSAVDGKEIWMAKTGYTIYDSCARAGDGFVTINSVPGIVNVLNQPDGKMIGQFRLGRGHAFSTSAVAGKRIYAASFSNRLVCLEC